jgi:hypothetical protein
MVMDEGQIYHCGSCHAEIREIRPSAEARENPKCRCGAPMKKFYKKPSVRKVSLRSEVLTVAKTNRS